MRRPVKELHFSGFHVVYLIPGFRGCWDHVLHSPQGHVFQCRTHNASALFLVCHFRDVEAWLVCCCFASHKLSSFPAQLNHPPDPSPPTDQTPHWAGLPLHRMDPDPSHLEPDTTRLRNRGARTVILLSQRVLVMSPHDPDSFVFRLPLETDNNFCQLFAFDVCVSEHLLSRH